MTYGSSDRTVTVGGTGDTVVLRSSEMLASGGEGSVYLSDQFPDQAAKIYHRPSADIAVKLRLMIDNPPRIPDDEAGLIAIAWPEDVLLDPGRPRRVLGYLMRRVSGKPAVECYSPLRRPRAFPFFTYQHLLATARNLARVIEICHGQRYVIGDINESNALVSDAASVSLIDTDSFQVLDRRDGRVYRSPVGKPEYTPAELQGHRFDTIDRSQDHDMFGLAVIIYQILMEGIHPFDGVYAGPGDAPQRESRIANGHFPHSRIRAVPYRPSPLSPSWDTLHPSLRDRFIQCFDNGHDSPETRPTAHEWVQTLEDAQASLVSCARNGQHSYFDHLANCPWCHRSARMRGRDSFPPLSGSTRPVPPSFTPPSSPRAAPVPAPRPARATAITTPPTPRPAPTRTPSPVPTPPPAPIPPPSSAPPSPAPASRLPGLFPRRNQYADILGIAEGILVGIALLLVGMDIGAPTDSVIGLGGLIAFTFLVASEALVLIAMFSILLIIRLIFWALPSGIVSSLSKNLFSGVGITILALSLIAWACLSLFNIISLSGIGELFTRNDEIVDGFLDWVRIIILAIVGIAVTSIAGLLSFALEDEESVLRNFSNGICLVPIGIILALVAAIVIAIIGLIIAIIYLIGAAIVGVFTWFF